MASQTIAEGSPWADDVRALLRRHLEFAREHTPPGHVHALDVDALLTPDITLYTMRSEGQLLGVGALRQLDPSHAEVKSMHTSESARGQGVGRAMIEHLLSVAAERSYERVSLETGTMAAFAPARALLRVDRLRSLRTLRRLHEEPQQYLYDAQPLVRWRRSARGPGALTAAQYTGRSSTRASAYFSTGKPTMVPHSVHDPS